MDFKNIRRLEKQNVIGGLVDINNDCNADYGSDVTPISQGIKQMIKFYAVRDFKQKQLSSISSNMDIESAGERINLAENKLNSVESIKMGQKHKQIILPSSNFNIHQSMDIISTNLNNNQRQLNEKSEYENSVGTHQLNKNLSSDYQFERIDNAHDKNYYIGVKTQEGFNKRQANKKKASSRNPSRR